MNLGQTVLSVTKNNNFKIEHLNPSNC